MRSTRCEHVSLTQDRFVIDVANLTTGPRCDDVKAEPGALSTSPDGSSDPARGCLPWVIDWWRLVLVVALPFREVLVDVEAQGCLPIGTRWDGER